MDTDMVVDTYRFGFIVYINKDDIIKILQKMLKLDLIFQIMNQIDHFLKEKSNWINER